MYFSPLYYHFSPKKTILIFKCPAFLSPLRLYYSYASFRRKALKSALHRAIMTVCLFDISCRTDVPFAFSLYAETEVFMHFRKIAAALCAVLSVTLASAAAASPKVAVSDHKFMVNGKAVTPQAIMLTAITTSNCATSRIFSATPPRPSTSPGLPARARSST